MQSNITKNRYFFLIGFGLYFAVLLWVTIFCRIGDFCTEVYYPFESYVRLFQGETIFIFYNLLNIALFIPLGVFLARYFKYKFILLVTIGVIISVFIELVQFVFHLGTVEFDDIINNTIGVLLGLLLFKHPKSIINLHYKDIFVLILACAVFSLLPVGKNIIVHEYMIDLASQMDLEDGTENLLILNGEWGFVGDSNVFVYYSIDGLIHIRGSSDCRAWKKIGEVELEDGVYSVSGFSGMNTKTFTIEFETIDSETGNYIDLVPELGNVSEGVMVIKKPTTVFVYVGVYPGSSGNATARPVIYKEA